MKTRIRLAKQSAAIFSLSVLHFLVLARITIVLQKVEIDSGHWMLVPISSPLHKVENSHVLQHIYRKEHVTEEGSLLRLSSCWIDAESV